MFNIYFIISPFINKNIAFIEPEQNPTTVRCAFFISWKCENTFVDLLVYDITVFTIFIQQFYRKTNYILWKSIPALFRKSPLISLYFQV